MTAAFHHVKWDGYPSFDIGFDTEAPDAYTDWIRNHDRPEPGLQYVLSALHGAKKLIDLGANIGYYTPGGPEFRCPGPCGGGVAQELLIAGNIHGKESLRPSGPHTCGDL